jgi:hypothetical protein
LDGTDPVPEPTNPAPSGEAASTSSTPTGGSSPADPIADLGEQILAELGDARTNDTLTRWLSHYTARLISEADSARNSGDPKADSLEAKARDAILDLWRARSAWPNGWPPPRAAAITRLLDQLPALDDEVNWYQQTALQRLHAIHYQILAGLVDLAAGNDTHVEQKWLDKYGEHLTPDEANVLRRVTQQPRRAETLLRWSARTQSNQLGDDKDGTSVAAGQPLPQLADAYHATITNLLERISTSEAKDPRTEDTT